MSDRGDYEVGYGKPPKDHQFKPGESGNVKGLRAAAPSLVEDLASELRRKIRITQNGKTESITIQKLIVRATAAKAAKGDMKAIGWIDAIISRPIAPGDPESQRALSMDDREILAAMLADLKQDPGAFDEPG